METSLSSRRLSESFSDGWLKYQAQTPPSYDRLNVDASLGHSFNSSTSFIDMDPTELFSMRWTSTASDVDFDFGLAVGPCSPLLVNAGHIFCDGHLLPGEPNCIAHDDGVSVNMSSTSSPVFHSAQSTPAYVISSRPGLRGCIKARPLVATRRLLLRYLRFLMPLCRKVRTLRVFPARSRASAASPPRRSTSSFSSTEYWCHGNADTAVRDAILYCKKSIGQDM